VLNCQPEDSRQLIEESLLMLRPLADSKRITICDELAPVPRVELDRERFFQVLSNLIGNAIKFTPEGGTITVRTELQRNELLFTVSDSGPGIAPAELPHVFNRYWQARSERRLGSGLGLYIAKGIIEAHGGRIWVEAPPGSGARFQFTLLIR
jgi:signal transduction histidine kinase